jgi:peptidoglycan hydrolase-like protein with peptidoglycan-binding domain
MKTISRALALVLTFGLFLAPAAPVFALGELPPVETPPVVDLCPNIDGAQASIPSGMVLDGLGNCITPDTTPPVISGVANQSLLSTAATIVWTTDDLSISTFEYGTTQTYGSSASISASLGIGGTALLTGLSPSTTYYYCIHATNAATLASQSCSSFATAAAADTTGPVISGLVKTALANEATIAWTTNELATSTIRWGTTQSYGNTLAVNVTAGLAHTGTLLSLAPSTTYYYCIDATDLAHNLTTSCDSFSTAALSVQASDPPVLSLVAVTSINTTSATVTWTTDKVSSTRVQYGTTAGYGSATTLDTSLALTHSANLSGLSANTLYHYRVLSADSDGHTTTGPDETFTTATVSGNGGTGVSLTLSSVETSSITASSTIITWSSNVAGDTQVEYGVNSSFGSITTLNASLTTSHTVTLSGLAENTNYIFRVKSKPVGASVATVSTNYEFSTLPAEPPVSTPAVISSISASPAPTAATVTWSTDKMATSFLEYGITTTYGLEGTLNTSLSTSHTQSLTNLEPSTTYHYRVISVDADHNITTSNDHTFTTSAPVSGPIAAPAAVTVSVSDHGHAYATLSWNVASALVDTAATYDIRYSTSPITEQNFASATKAQEPVIGYEDLQPSGISRTYTVVDLNPSTLYYFAVKSKYQASDWSVLSSTPSVTTSGLSVVTPSTNTNSSTAGTSIGGGGGGASTNGTTIASPSSVTAVGNDAQVTLNWKNPADSSFVRIVIVEKENSYPTSPTDGEKVYEGRGETFTDIEAAGSSATTDYFAIYAFDKNGNYSAPVRVSLSSQPGNTQTAVKAQTFTPRVTKYSFPDAIVLGDTGFEVEHLQLILAAHPELYPKRLVTGYFGSYTKTAVQKFQKQQGLTQTGVADPKTTALLNALSPSDAVVTHVQESSTFDQNLQYGQTASDVEALQQFLVGDGDYTGAVISEYFGSITKNAVIRFQQKYGITPAQGYVGPKTRAQIKTLLGL